MALDQEAAALLQQIRRLSGEIGQLADRLAELVGQGAHVQDALGAQLTEVDQSPGRARQASSKYRAMAEWLQSRRTGVVAAHFGEIEAVLGFPLPSSARKQVAAWYGVQGSSLARAIRDAGFRASRVDVVQETVEFHRVGLLDAESPA